MELLRLFTASRKFFLVGFLTGFVQAGEYCTTSEFYPKYCSFGCCSDGLYDECCSINIGLIVGWIVGGLSGLCFIACMICVICTLVAKKKHRQGTVIQPVNTTMVVATSASNQSNQQGFVQYNPQPPGYAQYTEPTSWQQNYSNPAYPPPYPGTNSNNHPPPVFSNNN